MLQRRVVIRRGVVGLLLLLMGIVLIGCAEATPAPVSPSSKITQTPESMAQTQQEPVQQEPVQQEPVQQEPTPVLQPLEPVANPSGRVEPAPREVCVDFSQIPEADLGVVLERPGLRIWNAPREPLRLLRVDYGAGLAVHPEGLVVAFTAPVYAVRVQVGAFAGDELAVTSYDANGNEMETQAAPPDNEVHELAFKGDAFRGVVLRGGGFEGALFGVCILTDSAAVPPTDTDPAEGWAPYPPGYQLPGDGQVVPGYPPMRAGVETMAPELKKSLLGQGSQINTARTVVVEEAQTAGDLFERVAIAPIMPAMEAELVCITFDDLEARSQLESEFEKESFTFRSVSGDGFDVQPIEDLGRNGLRLPGDGVDIALPGPSQRVLADIVQFNPAPVLMAALDEAGEVIAKTQTPADQASPLNTLDVSAPDQRLAASVHLEGGQWEAVLLKLCAQPPGDGGAEFPSGPKAGQYVGMLTIETNVEDSWLPSGAYLERVTPRGEGGGGIIELISVDSGKTMLEYEYLPTAFDGEPTALPVAYIVLGSKVCRTCSDGFCVCRTCSFWQRLFGQGMEPSECVP